MKNFIVEVAWLLIFIGTSTLLSWMIIGENFLSEEQYDLQVYDTYYATTKLDISLHIGLALLSVFVFIRTVVSYFQRRFKLIFWSVIMFLALIFLWIIVDYLNGFIGHNKATSSTPWNNGEMDIDHFTQFLINYRNSLLILLFAGFSILIASIIKVINQIRIEKQKYSSLL